MELARRPTILPRNGYGQQYGSELGTPDRTVVILQASRLERWKGQAVHLAALGLLRDVPGWECWLAGGVQKSGRGKVSERVAVGRGTAGIADRVRFLGQRADMRRLMAAADMFCQPNTGPEPFGIVFVEALYAGLPVVTSGFGGAAEIVDQTCGVLTAPGDTEAVASALEAWSRIQPGAGRLARPAQPSNFALRPGPSNQRRHRFPANDGMCA